MQVTEKKLAKLDVAYQSYLEQQAQLEDPVRRLEVSTGQYLQTLLLSPLLDKNVMFIDRYGWDNAADQFCFMPCATTCMYAKG